MRAETDTLTGLWRHGDLFADRREAWRDSLLFVEDAPRLRAEPESGYTGAGQTVVVIDTGQSRGWDQSATVAAHDYGWRNDANAHGFSDHGSMVAEVVRDTATGVEIIHLKVFDDFGNSARLVDIEEALDHVIALAADTAIAAVNLSLGSGNATGDTVTRLSDEFAALDTLDIVTTVAAGNSGATYADGISTLAANDHVIAVSAVDDTGAFADFSQRSATLTDIAAPGVGIAVTDADGDTTEVSGTSFAAPMVAGIAALLQEAALDLMGERLSDEEVLDILQRSGTPVAGAEDAPGYAVADADAALDWLAGNLALYDDDPLTA